MSVTRVILFMLFVECVPMSDLAAESVAIVNIKCAESTLEPKYLKNIFLDKKGAWSDGTKITIYMNEANEIHREFLDTHVKKTPAQFNAFWKKKVFTGKGRMPDKYADDAAMIAAVAQQVGSIGYVERSSAEGAAGIKILEIR